MLPNLWEQITHSPFSSLTLWSCHQRIVSCLGICRREVAESCSAPFTHGFSISCHGSCNFQTASQKGEGKKGRHTWLLLPLPLLPDQDQGSVTQQLLCWGELNANRERNQRQTPTRPWGRQEGWTSRGNRCAGVRDSAGLAQWKDDTMAHREIQNLGHGVTAGEPSELGHLHQIQRSNQWNLAEDYFLISFPLLTNIRML